VTAGTVRETKRRLVIPAPDAGWLSLVEKPSETQLLDIVDGWQSMTTISLAAAGIPEYRRAHVWVIFHPREVAEQGVVGIHVAEDLRPTWHIVRRTLALAKPPVRTHHEKLVLGRTVDDPYLVLELTEVAP
jgi:hypothetical protein